jgi:hypothetical protein
MTSRDEAQDGDSTTEDRLDAGIAEIMRDRLAKSTRATYKGAFSRFSKFMELNYPSTCIEGLDLNLVTTRMVQAFLFHIRDSMGISALNGYRAAIKYAFAEENVDLPNDYARLMTEYFGGLKRQDAQKKKSGEIPSQTGKSPLPMSLYKLLMKYLICSPTENHRWGQFYGVLTWNLMCRVNNTGTVHVSRINHHNDSLRFYFATTKTDQEGENCENPIHVYANPTCPEICPILALGVYLLYFEIGSDGMIFAGDSPEKRFSAILGKVLRGGDLTMVMEEHGLPCSKLGSHSMRKGSATYTSSGSAEGPSITSICNRAGWKISNVLDRYLKYERASDQYCGRVVSGLPLEDEKFALLPPHFPYNDQFVNDAILQCFDSLSDRVEFRSVLRICLASLVYHEDWLRENVVLEAGFFSTNLFGDADLLNSLKARVISGYDSPHMTATGIPAHVTQIRGMSEMMEEVKGLRSIMESSVLETVDKMSEMIDGKNFQQGILSQESILNMNQAILDMGESIKDVYDCIRSGESMPTSSRINGTLGLVPSPVQRESLMYTWQGAIHYVPENWEMPKVNVRTGWLLWCVGKASDGIPPLRILTSHDLKGPVQQKKFNEWKALYGSMEKYLAFKDCSLSSSTTAQECYGMFDTCTLMLRGVSGSKRFAQLQVPTLAKKCRRVKVVDLKRYYDMS